MSVTPYVGVWIETLYCQKTDFPPMSHPTWVCGLKHIYKNDLPDDVTSHPTWVCGLKPYYIFGYMSNRLSHPTWVCGLKQKQLQQEAKAYAKSHPTWVCGLKLERLYSA